MPPANKPCVHIPAVLAGLVIAPAMGVGLGSWLAAAWGALWIPYVVRGTAKADRTLITKLPSYDAYARHAIAGRIERRL
jgi:hypothetical protein